MAEANDGKRSAGPARGPHRPSMRVDLGLLGLASGLAPGVCLALLLVFERRLLRSLTGVSATHAVAVVGALLLAYLLRAFLTTMAEPGLGWMPWAFVLAAAVATARGLSLGMDASAAGAGGEAARDAAVLRLSWHLFLPLYALAAIRPAVGRRVAPALTVAWAALILAIVATGASTDSAIGIHLVEPGGRLTTTAVVMGLMLGAVSLAVTALWARRVGFRPLAPQAWVGTSLWIGALSLLAWSLSGRVGSALWWTSLFLAAAQFVVPALGLLVSLVTIYRAMDRYERYLEERLAHMIDDERADRSSPSVDDDSEARAGTEKLLGVMTVVFQPVVRLGDAKVVGLEALARSTAEPERSPETFFAEAEECGLGPELELRALHLALAHLDDVGHHCYLAVNLSPGVLAGPEVRSVLDGVTLDRLVIEVTERAAIEDFEQLSRAVQPLREAGMRLAIDDTGAGYAGLRHVLGLRPDIVKLDIDLCREIDSDSMRGELAQALATFTTGVGSTLVAEGVETPEAVRELMDRGAKLGQGFHLGRPGSLEEAFSPEAADRT